MSLMDNAPDPGICLLADHLDAALAAGEDLLAEQLAPAADREAATAGTAGGDAVGDFVRRLAHREAAIVARVLQARRRIAELPRLDRAMQSLLGLFQAQTSGLLDLIATFGDRSAEEFRSGDDALAFLRMRGLLDPEAASLPRFASIAVDERYRLAGIVELGGLLDVVGRTLDALDLHYGLYDADEPTAETAAATPPAGADDAAAPAAPDAAAEPTGSGAPQLEAEPAHAPTPGSLAAALAAMTPPGEAPAKEAATAEAASPS